ncbi:MAG: CBS domain-containing protein, partial [Kofleriaceae bacterium]
IHHLPVVDDDCLVGIVSGRDLAAIGGDERVGDVMTPDVATVTLGAGLDEVVNMMEAGKFGSVVITAGTRIEGIFTVTDAVRAFGDLLRRLDEEQR